MTDTAPHHATTAALLDDLRRQLGRPDLAYETPPVPLSGGFWAEVYAIRLAGGPAELGGDLVARVMPDADPARREAIIQREVAVQGFPAPAVRASGDGPRLGRTYMLMDRAAGAPLLSGVSGARAVLSVPGLVRRLPRLLASTALDLHLLDPAPVIAALDRDLPGAAIGADDLLAHLTVRADELDDALLRGATAWLAAHRPEAERSVICHGDLHPLNLLVDDARRVTLIDWTAARISEPAFDLAFTTLLIRAAPLDVPRWLRAPLRKAAAWLADEVVRTYRDLARPHGITLDDDRLRWHTALQATRMLAEVGSWPQPRPDHPFSGMAERLRLDLAATVGR